jgi:hypothetical protein
VKDPRKNWGLSGTCQLELVISSLPKAECFKVHNHTEHLRTIAIVPYPPAASSVRLVREQRSSCCHNSQTRSGFPGKSNPGRTKQKRQAEMNDVTSKIEDSGMHGHQLTYAIASRA